MTEVNPSQTKLQKILWKNSKTAPTTVCELKTVTSGTTSALYLATRVLQQLALDEEKDFPLASEVPLQDFYMMIAFPVLQNLTSLKNSNQN
ncbi:integrase catalytic domain-containing protein [Trichonephila clavipes]|nr:integrase catalytic domain-containing protein [Trichonephila clavipes]